MTDNLENKINTMDLADLAIQIAAKEFSAPQFKGDESHAEYAGLAIQNYLSSRSDYEKVFYKYAFDNLKSSYEQAINNFKRKGKFNLDEHLSNYFESMEQGYAYSLDNAKLADLNKALEKLGYGEKLTGDENLTVKEIIEKGKADNASDLEKAMTSKVAYASQALIKLGRIKLETISIDKNIKQHNENTTPQTPTQP